MDKKPIASLESVNNAKIEGLLHVTDAALQIACLDLASSVYSNESEDRKREIALVYMADYLDKAFKLLYPSTDTPSFKEILDQRL